MEKEEGGVRRAEEEGGELLRQRERQHTEVVREKAMEAEPLVPVATSGTVTTAASTIKGMAMAQGGLATLTVREQLQARLRHNNLPPPTLPPPSPLLLPSFLTPSSLPLSLPPSLLSGFSPPSPSLPSSPIPPRQQQQPLRCAGLTQGQEQI